MLVFRDGKGYLYVLPREMLERFHVPREMQAEVEQAIAAEDVVHLGYPTSPAPPSPSDPFYGLRYLGEWPLPDLGPR